MADIATEAVKWPLHLCFGKQGRRLFTKHL
jgi:hypothetical protein